MTAQLSQDLSKKNQKWVHIAIIAFMALITGILFHEAFNPNKMMIANDQISGMGWRATLQDGIKDGQFSAWNRGMLGGMPTIDAKVGDPFYPLTFIFNYFTPLYDAYAFKMIMHVFLAGLFFYLMLLKGFKFSPVIAGIGAVFYMLNPQFLSHVFPGHDGKMFVIALLPLMIWVLKEGLDKPTLLKTALLGILTGLGHLTGHTQMMYFALWGLGAVWLFWAILKISETKNAKILIKPSLFFWGGVFLGLALAALQFYPSYQFVRDAHSIRGIDRGFAFATSWSMHFAEVMSLWVMEFGNWNQYYWGENFFKLNTEYVGAVATILAVLAFVFKPMSPWRIFWAAFALFTLLYCLGANSPGIRFGENPEDVVSVYTLFYWFVPGVNRFRANAMIMFWVAFVIVLLSSLSLKDIWSESWKNWSPKRLLNTKKGLLIGIGAITLISLLFANRDFNFDISNAFSPNFENVREHNAKIWELNFERNFLPALLGWWIIASIILASLWAVLSGRLKKEVFVGIIFVLGMIDLIRVNTQFIRFESNAQYRRVPSAVSEVLRRTKNEPARSMFLPGTHQNANIEAFFRLEGVNGFHDNELVRYREFRGQGGMNFLQGVQTFEHLINGNNTLNLANCRFIFYATPTGQLAFVENVNALPRLAFTNSFEVIEDRGIISRRLLNPNFNANRTTILEQRPNFTSAREENISTQISTRWLKNTANIRIAEVEVPTNGLLRVSEVFYPAWRIYINGKRAEILNADIAFMAVEIPAGKHKIEMKIDSLYMARAMPFFIAGVIIVLIIFGREFWLRKK